MPVVHKILVAFDDPASRTLEHAADLALALGSELIVTNVAPADPEDRDEADRYGRERLDQARATCDVLDVH